MPQPPLTDARPHPPPYRPARFLLALVILFLSQHSTHAQPPPIPPTSRPFASPTSTPLTIATSKPAQKPVPSKPSQKPVPSKLSQNPIPSATSQKSVPSKLSQNPIPSKPQPIVGGNLPKDFVLRWGADSSGGMPFVFSSPQDPNQLIGFEKEIVDAISKSMGVPNRFHRANWATLVPDLQRKTFDIIVNGLEPTSDRAKVIAFSKPYYIFRQQLTVRKSETKIKTLDDCKGRLIGTLENTAASRLLESKKLRYRGYDDQSVAYKDLEIGRLDAVLMDYPIALYFANSPKFKPAGPPFHRGAYIIGMRQQDTLLKQKIDAAIDRIMQDGTLERILRKWRLWDDIQKELAAGTAKYEITTMDFNWPNAFKRLGMAAIITIGLAFGAMLIAMLLGLLIALGQLHTSSSVRVLSTVYVEFFRGTPVLVQLLFLYFSLPMIGIMIPNWLTAIIGLGLNYAAYESQVYRTALQSIPPGQWEAAAVLGMGPWLTFRRVIFPQAFRVALPPMTNDFVALFKDTSVAFAISVWELATAYRELASASQKFMILGALTSLFYLAMSVPLSYLARRLEARLQGQNQQDNPKP